MAKEYINNHCGTWVTISDKDIHIEEQLPNARIACKYMAEGFEAGFFYMAGYHSGKTGNVSDLEHICGLYKREAIERGLIPSPDLPEGTGK